MKRYLLLTIICVWSCYSSFSQQSNLWEAYKKAQKNGKEAILPNFAYAGYKFSEEDIPYVHHKVFNVLDFGAQPNDEVSDKHAIKLAVDAAIKNGSGVIYFPRGKYYINTQKDDQSSILITTSNIVFRGEDQENTVLFFDKDLPPEDPDKLWTCPYAIKATSKGQDEFLSNILSDSKRETFNITVEDASQIKEGDWLSIQLTNNDKGLVDEDIAPLEVDKAWTSLLTKGVVVNEKHQVASVQGNEITLVSPMHYNIKAKHGWKVFRFSNIENIGFENLTFEGHWTKEFVHHKSAQHDGGWSILSISKATNSWIKNCVFKNVNRAASISFSAACTVLNVKIEGAIGHSAIHASRSTEILIANCNDMAGMHHSFGVDGYASGTVIWRSKYPAHTCFEAHASQPRCTLLDNVEGGFFQGRAGGARSNLPNHGRYLVLWNYKEIDEAEEHFRFVAHDTWYWRIVPPIIVGFHGAGTTFKQDEVQVLESLGTPVKPESLFEAQLKMRLGKTPRWIKNLRSKQ
ncbi:DUF4955 domain-containing protein [Tamlana fucoidanivorans]|uniref:DUF4955 domain-containing protein n=1 Tax=Allotamlana fucoidanivorans TaxID=2583814 RepID=A0A5C4SG18_9FLAO|nr:DUF4955 domain-containing protein [Tamlana fucoidanivorans]TNJ42524.1 DUF4955 domain-containing protein [Tamlana fucoidanivorans]